jgi:ABC-type nitrate/sulfonate/bicarbonate transport system substrate-binding protein
MKRIAILTATIALAATVHTGAFAADVVKATVGQQGNWDTAVGHLGTKAGIFKRHNIELDLVYTRGSGETLQPVISANVDLGIAVGTLGAIGAFSKGAPIRIIAAEATGAADFWYAKATSGIKSLKDTDGKTMAYSTNGSSTHSMVLALIKENNLKAKPTATGSPAATLTAVMSDQVDIGWSAPPFGLKEMEEGKINLVARGNDAAIVRGQTIRVIIANADAIAKRKDVLRRFMQAYRETIDYMYSDNPQVMKDYAEFARIPEAMAKRVRDEFFPKDLMQMGEIKGLDELLKDAVELKYTPQPLTKQQVGELVQIHALTH